MKYIRRIAALLLVFSSLGFLQACQGEGMETGKGLATALRRSDVVAIDVIVRSPQTTSVTQVTPDVLKTAFDYKVQIRGGIAYYQDSLASVLDGMRFKRQSLKYGYDVCWGVIFYDHHGRRMASIYINRDGKSGAVDGHQVVFVPGKAGIGLGDWLTRNFHFH